MRDFISEQLGNYRIDRLLGSGGFAAVYHGQHIYLNTPAAIKVLHIRLDKEALADFLAEARTIVHLEHPNIIRVLEFGMQDHTPYLVMSYAPHGSMRQKYPQGSTVPLSVLTQYTRQIADALQYAHDQKIIHRDIKPENILLGRYGEVLLSDFGLAIAYHTTHSMPENKKAGTTLYMAPEQMQGKPTLTSDQYSLGVMVYEWLCGSPPFMGTDLEIAIQHQQAQPTPLRERIATISPAVEQVVLKALSKEPRQRFPGVQIFAQELEKACRLHESVLSSPTNIRASDFQSAQFPATKALFDTASTENDRSNRADDISAQQEHLTSELPGPPATSGLDAKRRGSPRTPITEPEPHLFSQHEEVFTSPPAYSSSSNHDESQKALRNIYLAATKDQPFLPEQNAAVQDDAVAKNPDTQVIPSRAQSNRRLSRRAVVAGLIGATAIGAGGFWYLHNSQFPASRVVASAGQTPNGTGASRSGTLTSSSGGVPSTSKTSLSAQTSKDATSSTPTSSHASASSTSTSSQTGTTPTSGTSTSSQTGTTSTTNTNANGSSGAASTPAPTAAPAPATSLTVSIDTSALPSPLSNNTNESFNVVTNTPNVSVVVHVTYTVAGFDQTLGPQTTDSNGQATFSWRVHTTKVRVLDVLATLTATVTDANGQSVTSDAVQLTVVAK